MIASFPILAGTLRHICVGLFVVVSVTLTSGLSGDPRGPLHLSPVAEAADFDPAKLALIKPRMQQFVDDKHLAGAVTLVGSAHGIASLDVVGHRDLATQAPMTRDTLFRIASMTKPITALAVMQLADAGKLSVDDPVEKHLPTFRDQWLVAARSNAEVTLKRPARPITIRDLLTHTSGLPGGFPAGAADLYVQRNLSLAEAVLLSSQRPLDFEPGAKWAYCNAGIDTLGRIVEVVSGQSFEAYLDEHLFRPLGMANTTFYPDPTQRARIATVYDRKNEQLVPAPNLIIGPTPHARHPIPAGGLYSTADDLARLYQALLHQATPGAPRIISPANWQAMTKVQTGDLVCGFVPGMGFGYGFAVIKEPQGVTGMLSAGTYGHGGAFGTQAWLDPQRGIYIVLLIQRVGLPNGDGTDFRKELQRLAVEALR